MLVESSSPIQDQAQNDRSIKVGGEAVSVALTAAEKYTDITGLLWNRMPTRTFLIKNGKKMQGHKPKEDIITVMLGASESGELNLKSPCIYRSLCPHALKNLSFAHVPVFWRAKQCAWVTT